MILINWLKRIRAGSGFCGFSASSWNKVCNVLETIEGIGCTIHKTLSGNGWTIVVDGKSSDTPYPEGLTPGTGDPEDPPPPTCGHPGNDPDGDHPGDGGGSGSEGSYYTPGGTGHPGDDEGENGVTPECGSESTEIDPFAD